VTALACPNATATRCRSLATAEPSPAGGWRARCSCGAMWRLTPLQVERLGLDARTCAARECAPLREAVAAPLCNAERPVTDARAPR
jgi:hypothetical protein